MRKNAMKYDEGLCFLNRMQEFIRNPLTNVNHLDTLEKLGAYNLTHGKTPIYPWLPRSTKVSTLDRLVLEVQFSLDNISFDLVMSHGTKQTSHYGPWDPQTLVHYYPQPSPSIGCIVVYKELAKSLIARGAKLHYCRQDALDTLLAVEAKLPPDFDHPLNSHPSRHPCDWTVDEVCNWVESLFPKFDSTIFKSEWIDGKALLSLTPEELKSDLKLPLGVRKTLALEIEKLK